MPFILRQKEFEIGLGVFDALDLVLIVYKIPFRHPMSRFLLNASECLPKIPKVWAKYRVFWKPSFQSTKHVVTMLRS